MTIIPSTAFDIANILIRDATYNFKEIPKPIDWYEPSINMLYLEAISSFIFGNYLSSLTTMLHLLEHSIKMAIFDAVKNGKFRNASKDKMIEICRCDLYDIFTGDKYKARLKYLLETDENVEWWNNIARHLRNNVSHTNFPNFIKFYNNEEWQGEYSNTELQPYDSGDWGFVFHRWGRNVSKKFNEDATHQLKILLKNTFWKSDETWWISQKKQYDKFFSYKWEYTNIAQSIMKLNKYYPQEKARCAGE